MNCVRSPNSARNTTAKDVAATGQKPSRTPSRPASSSASFSPSCRHSRKAPAANTAAARLSTSRCGSRLSAPPAATASVTWTANAAAAPVNTNPGRYRLLRIRQASTVLSGSSAGSTARKDVIATVKLIPADLRVSGPAGFRRANPGPPARQRHAAAEGLTRTVAARSPGHRAREAGSHGLLTAGLPCCGPRLSMSRRWSYSPSRGPMLAQAGRSGHVTGAAAHLA